MRLLETLHTQNLLRQQLHLQRQRRVHAQRDGTIAIVDGQNCVNFSSNDYLGFAQHPRVIKAFQNAAQGVGVGSAGSALVSGHFSAHQHLEQQAAEFFGYEACLFVSSGYLANLGVLQSLLDEKSLCVQDKLNHASLLDGARYSGATLKRFAHKDYSHAENFCHSANAKNLLIASDAVFSMDGDCADLNALNALAKRHQACLMIDDAHGFGVCGNLGFGSVVAANLSADDVHILIVPAGKALGGQGAFILSNQAIISHLIESARSYIFSTAPAPAMAAALSESLRVLQTEPEHHATLQQNIEQFNQLAKQSDLPFLPSQTATQILLLGENQRALNCANYLQQSGFWISAIRPPTVAVGKARLRITISAKHSAAQITALFECLQAWDFSE